MRALRFCVLSGALVLTCSFLCIIPWTAKDALTVIPAKHAVPSHQEPVLTTTRANAAISVASGGREIDSVQRGGGAQDVATNSMDTRSLQRSSNALQLGLVGFDVETEGSNVHLVVKDKDCGKVASWKYGQRVALFFGKWCKNECKSKQIRNDCLQEKPLNSLCIIFPDPLRPCHMTEDDKHMWNVLERRKPKAMVDIGTNIGDSASLFPHWGVEVWGFDPMPQNLFWLKLNRLANRMSGVTFPLHIFEGGASNRDADISFTNTGASGSTHAITGNEAGDANAQANIIKSHVFRVSDHIKQRVALFKMDAEGHEPEALQGALEFLCKYGAEVLMFEYAPRAILQSSQVKPVAFTQMITQLGFQCTILGFGTPVNFRYFSKNSGRHDLICKPLVAASRALCANSSF